MTRSIVMYPLDDLPADLQASMKASCGEKYRPSNGTEGEVFFENWCCQCARDKAMSEGFPIEECDDNQRCDIISRTFAHNVEDAEYPKEWCYDENGQPRCTAFIQAGEPVRDRCQNTPDMFE